jgi:hypothetical protein
MKKLLVFIGILSLAFCLSGALVAQPDPHGSQNGNSVGGGTLGAGAPIRGGATILIAFCVAYTMSRYKWPS